MKLRLRIAADPEAFFALADTTQDDSLSPKAWLEACRSSLGNADETECRAVFDEMDLDKDGRVSREEFIDMRNAIRLFLKDAKCQEMLIEVMAGLVAAHWKSSTPLVKQTRKKEKHGSPECAECRDVDHVTTQQASGAESQKS